MAHRRPKVSKDKCVCVSYDGVINDAPYNTYDEEDNIPDRQIPGAVEWLTRMVRGGYTVYLHSLRAKTYPGIQAVRHQLVHWGVSADVRAKLVVTYTLPNCGLFLSPIAKKFTGSYPSPMEVANLID